MTRPNGSDVLLDLIGHPDSITIKDQFGNFQDMRHIDEIRFADGTVWTSGDLIALASGTALVGGTKRGTDQDDVLTGGAAAEVFDAGGGNDILIGGMGADSYHFDLGDGSDSIFEAADAGASDLLILGAGILPGDLVVTQSVSDPLDAVVVIGDGSDSIYLDQQFAGNGEGVEEFHFADGTVWLGTALPIFDPAAAAGPGDDRISREHLRRSPCRRPRRRRAARWARLRQL